MDKLNEFQKALEAIHGTLFRQKMWKYDGNGDFSDVMNSEDLEKLQELVDKQTPMKPIKEDGIWLCGECKNNTIYTNSFQDLGEEWCCYACGRVIDWSDKE